MDSIYCKGMRKIAILALFLAIFTPALASAKGLTHTQADAITTLLASFGVDNETLEKVADILEPKQVLQFATASVATSTPEITIPTPEVREDATCHVGSHKGFGPTC